MKLAFALLVCAGCKNLLGLESGVVGDSGVRDEMTSDDATDAEIDGSIDAPLVDARACFGTYQQICLTQTPPPEFHVDNSLTIDTATGCTETQTIGGVDMCIRSAKTITIDAGKSVATSGTKFVVLVATEQITISGVLDGWDAGSGACNNNDSTGVNVGGPGGSLGSVGGNGGAADGAAEPADPVPATITTFRRGCQGGDGGATSPPGGRGGDGGSGIFLVAPSIHLTSTARVNASGDGGDGGQNNHGGGGGGSGGLIVFDSESLAIDAGAIVVALGGGGGGGGGGAGAAVAGTRAIATQPIMAGDGGRGSQAPSGDGGDGGLSGGGSNGGTGTNGRGGGGGGGGRGVIFVTATTPSISGTVQPATRVP